MSLLCHWGYHEYDNENWKILNLYTDNKSTSFQNKVFGKPWYLENTGANKIYNFMVLRRHFTSSRDIRAWRGPNCDSNHYYHYLVKIIIRNCAFLCSMTRINQPKRMHFVEQRRMERSMLGIPLSEKIKNQINRRRTKCCRSKPLLKMEWMDNGLRMKRRPRK